MKSKTVSRERITTKIKGEIAILQRDYCKAKDMHYITRDKYEREMYASRMNNLGKVSLGLEKAMDFIDII